ncbi:cation transporter [bacterium]|nr:cation transporter [bacterium]
MDINRKKQLTAGASILSNIILTTLKLIVGAISGSMSIISEAIHSLSDFSASVLTFFSVIKSSQPADKDHPYGHGKYEDMAGFIEGILIILAGVFIIYKSSKKIILGEILPAENNLGIAVMLIAVVINIIISSLLFKTAKEGNSISLYADAQHLRADVYSSFGVLIGLILIKYTGYNLLDPIIAILVACFICKTGHKIVKQSVMRLLDYSLPNDEITNLYNTIGNFSNKVKLKDNSLKARQVGPSTDIDFVLVFPRDTSLCQCHQICDEIEYQIRNIYPNASISIHSEPECYKKNCRNLCTKNCKNSQM